MYTIDPFPTISTHILRRPPPHPRRDIRLHAAFARATGVPHAGVGAAVDREEGEWVAGWCAVAGEGVDEATADGDDVQPLVIVGDG